MLSIRRRHHFMASALSSPSPSLVHRSYPLPNSVIQPLLAPPPAVQPSPPRTIAFYLPSCQPSDALLRNAAKHKFFGFVSAKDRIVIGIGFAGRIKKMNPLSHRKLVDSLQNFNPSEISASIYTRCWETAELGFRKRVRKRLVVGRPERAPSKEPAFARIDVQLADSYSVTGARDKCVIRLELRVQRLVNESRHSRTEEGGSKSALFMNMAENQWGHGLCTSWSLWRLCTRAANKRQVDVGNSVLDTQTTLQETNEEPQNRELDDGAELSDQFDEEIGSKADGSVATRNLAMAAVEATRAVGASSSLLVEATETVYRKKLDQSTPERQQTQQVSLGGCEEGSYTPRLVLEDESFLRKLAMAEGADEALAMITEKAGEPGAVLSNLECSKLIVAALAQNNAELAFSILNAMRCSLIQRRIDRTEGKSAMDASKFSWRWAQPDVKTYTTLVRGLAASLRVSDAIQTVNDVGRRGIPIGDEVPFGKVVKCPTCNIALAVVQPQHGIQVVPCSKCRYQYELMSGDVVISESESMSMDISAFERGLRALQLMKQPFPAAVHSMVVRAPNGLARTHRFATASADLPAQEGERVTLASAAPTNAGRNMGPLRISTRAPGWRPSEPMSISNHATDRVTPLLRAPPKAGSGAALDTSVILPAAFLLASSDAATALIDPTLPRMIAIGGAAAVALGTAINSFVLPTLNQLPQRTVDASILKQQLLAQYELLQTRLQELTRSAAEEIRMLARMCQLQNKMEAIGEPTYSARIERVRKAQEGLDERLAARLELIDSYAKISSMIEIEVEMDVDVLAAETVGAAASIAEQIERLMEVEDLQKQWKMQAEVNDEVERLLQSAPLLPDSS